MSDPGSAYYLNKPCRSHLEAAIDLAKSARRDLEGQRLMSSGPTLAAFDKIITLLEATEAGEGLK